MTVAAHAMPTLMVEAMESQEEEMEVKVEVEVEVEGRE